MKKLILFICNGNIYRSVIAEKYLTKILQEKDLDNKFSIASYGLQGARNTDKPMHKNLKKYPREYKAALPTLREFKIKINDHSSQKITPTAVKKATVIIAMDKKIYSRSKNSLFKQFPGSKQKIHIFSELTKNRKDIKDPFGINNSKFHRVIIENICLTIKKKFKIILDWANKE
jgi:protein-tyrosine-phosphatase